MPPKRNANRSSITWLALLSGLLLLLNLTPWMDKQAEDYLDRALQTAATAYVSARALNAVISVLQETEVELSAALVGVNLAPGQILDPINDLVERFSAWMLIATSSLAIQKFLLLVSASWPMKALFLAAVCAALWWFWRHPEGLTPGKTRLILSLLGVLILMRFALPVMALGSDALDRFFFQQPVQENLLELQKLQNEAEQVHQSLAQNSEKESQNGWIDQLSDAVRELGSPLLEWKQRLQNLQPQLEQGIHNLLQLIALFALQAMVLPMLFLWLMKRTLYTLMQAPTAKAE